MRQTDVGILHSPSDVLNFVACEHLAQLERRRALGELARPEVLRPDWELSKEKGHEHEKLYLEALKAEGRQVVELAPDFDEPEMAAARTLGAMRAGAEIIYQGTLFDGRWQGMADFLERVERPSTLGGWSYEVIDTKLARRTKPQFLLQLSFYSEQLARLQGIDPEWMHVVLGTRERESFATRDFQAYFRRVRDRFLGSIETGSDGYPSRVEHCKRCAWSPRCQAQWEADDHLALVANVHGDQIRRLRLIGIETLAALGRAPATPRPPRMAELTFEAMRDQARLQLQQRETRTPTYELLSPRPGLGFALLPQASAGDVFLDLEGDPYVDGGLEYLFGVFHREPSGWSYRPTWAHDSAEEKRAFEEFIDFVTVRRARDPGLHVYHYAAYEPAALKRLAARYGTRENALDDLLRGEVFVDLYRIVRQSLRASTSGYSLKDVEIFYHLERQGQVKSGGDSIVAYESFRESRDGTLLEEIALYNREDCESTRGLRDWLLERRVEAEERFGFPIEPIVAEVIEPNPKREQMTERHARLAARLAESAEAHPDSADARLLLAQLLDYHRREERAAWWSFFERVKMTDHDLVEDLESIGEMTLDASFPPIPDKQSRVYRFRFLPQESKMKAGDQVMDPATRMPAGAITKIDLSQTYLLLKRGPTMSAVGMPRSIVPRGPYSSAEQVKALGRLAEVVVDSGFGDDARYQAARDLLIRRSPRIRGLAPGQTLEPGLVDEGSAWPRVRDLDRGYLFVQGPPGSGKTWLAAQLIVRLLKEGKSVGVTALSHRAIHNLLHEVEKIALRAGVSFRGLKKASKDHPDTEYPSRLADPFVRNTEENPPGLPYGVQLLAGTAWLFSRESLAESLDTLFVDEAGQIALADALAVATSARNVVLLGDPQQLAQVSQGVHPEGADASVLEHLLGRSQTVAPDRGLFLSRTRRMHPDICRFVSDTFYDGRLESAPGLDRQRVISDGLSGSGIRYVPVEHAGNAQRSEEEAEVIAGEIERLLKGSFIDQDGGERPLTVDDILVVAPYNLQVRLLQERLPKGIRVGTVDRFQGLQAPVVFFSMATSGGEDIPRGLEFLFSRNRLNVAISRAQALAILVASPRLLNVSCRTVEQMRLVNALCAFVEEAPAVLVTSV